MRKTTALLLFVLASTLSAQLAPGPTPPLPPARSSLHFADITGDGRDDIVYDNKLYVNTGSAGFESPGPFVVAEPIADVFDINGDGVPEFLTRSESLQIPGASAPPAVQFHVFARNAAMQYKQIAAFPVGKIAYIADLDSDGRDDVVLANTEFEGVIDTGTRVDFLVSRGDGTFDEKGTLFAPSFYNVDFVRHYHLAAGDLNRDGHTDLVLRGLDQLGILLGKGDGTFAAPITRYLPRELGTVSPQLADVDGDGNLDFIFTAKDIIRVLLGDGRGHFTRESSASTNPRLAERVNAPKNLVVGQFTGKNAVEIAGGTHDGDLVVFAWRGNKLAEAGRVVTGLPGLMLTGADLHGDGTTDLFAEATASPVYIPGQFYFGRAAAVAAQTSLPATGARRRSVRGPGASVAEQRYKVVFGSECAAQQATNWRLERDGIFGVPVEGTAEAVFIGDSMYVRSGRYDYGVLARSGNEYTGQMYLSSCGGLSVRVVATPE